MNVEMRIDVVDELASIGFRDIIDQDSRPTFVLDLESDEIRKNSTSLSPTFCNAALRSHDRLLDIITGQALPKANHGSPASHYEEFRSWALGVSKTDDSMHAFPLSLLYNGMLWTGSTVRRRWRLISGNLCFQTSSFISTAGDIPVEQLSASPSAHSTPPHKRQHLQSRSLYTSDGDVSIGTPNYIEQLQRYNSSSKHISKQSSNDTGNTANITSMNLSVPESGVSDWTTVDPKTDLSEHVLFARSVNWGYTPLGRMEDWSSEFRIITNLVMQNPHPAALFWGDDLTMLYNQAYSVEVAGNKHPHLMGTGFQGPFAELWEAVSPIFRECARTGISVRKENQYLPMERYGYLEETFFSWSFTPLYGGTSKILGFYNAPFETTHQVINHRRTQMVNRLGESVALARTVKEFWHCVLDSLEENHYDVPFALLYSVGDSDDNDTSSMSSGSTASLKSCFFEGAIGIPAGHPAALQQLDLKRSREGFIPSFREAMRTREPTLLQMTDGTLPTALLEGINWRGFGDPCRECVIFPVRPTNGDNVLLFLVLGVNPRRAYDEEYKAFTSMLNRQLATSLASVLLFEEEIRRSKNAAEAAALQQEHLSQQLALQTSRLRRMTELSPLGMYLYTSDGVLLEANDRYYEMTGFLRDDSSKMSFMDHVEESSKSVMEKGWHQMTVERLPWTSELQLKKIFVNPLDLNNEPIDYWVMVNSQPETAEDGSVQIMGSITDISHLKWAQGLQDRRLSEAEETRRQQNEFIDITSHEIRNPLSAILQSAEEISTSLRSTDIPLDATVVENVIEAANTIAICVQHQQSIVDDILTVSKLDRNLLLITPSPVQLVTVLKRVMKIFASEMQAKDIKSNLMISPDIQELDIDWVLLDKSRLLQILINLITNAIKFSCAAPKRVITVAVGGSKTMPVIKTKGFQYIPRKITNANIQGGDWGSGEELCLRFKVVDTGCGLTDKEKHVLFQRFSQASPRTHAIYGGSGLGLFISRQLAELHGGQIGVASEAGVGSTFGFYIRAKRASAHMIKTLRGESTAGSTAQILANQISGQPGKTAIFSTGLSHSAHMDMSSFDPKHLHILVVEDNLVNQKVLVRQLKKLGSMVDVANNGIEALAHLETTAFRKVGGQPLSVILMDLEMPEMDGLTCVREIRKMEVEGKIHGKRVPVIAVTANVREEQVTAARGSGMDDVVSKPFRISDLLTKVDTLLSAMSIS